MRYLRCIFSVAVGTLLGLFTSCTPKETKSESDGPAQREQSPEEEKQDAPPDKEDDLPVRTPILE